MMNYISTINNSENKAQNNLFRFFRFVFVFCFLVLAKYLIVTISQNL